MIATLEIPADSWKNIEELQGMAEKLPATFARALHTSAVEGSERVRQGLLEGRYGLTMRNPASGLAACVLGWMIDEDAPLAAMGVPSNSPATAYAEILERGGEIRPVNAKALAIPVSEEAKQYTSPRDMPGLDFIPRKGRPPLLVRKLEGGRYKDRWEIHWVLLGGVTIPAFHWLTRGAEEALPSMVAAFRDVLVEEMKT